MDGTALIIGLRTEENRRGLAHMPANLWTAGDAAAAGEELRRAGAQKIAVIPKGCPGLPLKTIGILLGQE